MSLSFFKPLSSLLLVLAVWFFSFVHIERGVAQEVPVQLGSPVYCPAYRDSVLVRDRPNVIPVDVSDDWQFIVENAPPGSLVLFDDGTYQLNQPQVRIGSDVTLRSASGNRDGVTIRGVGYHRNGQGLVIAGDRVTIADLSVTGMRDHGIYVKPERGGGFAPLIYNVHVYDIGTQHIKSNKGSVQGMIACSLIGYTDGGAKGDYNGAIDLHGATAWHIRDNEIYNIAGDGSGCNVNQQCGKYTSGPAILVWIDSRDTIVERNIIKESYRNIAFGLGRGHTGGVIRDNIITRTGYGDAGIELQGAVGTVVENNSVLLNDRYLGAVEFRDSKHLVVRANRLSTPPWNRGNNVNVVSVGNTIANVPAAVVVRKPHAGCSHGNW